MIAVIFEFTPAEGRTQDYFDLVEQLKPELEKAEGLLSIERFESLSTKGRFVSLQFWKDEESVARWRNVELHRIAQAKGRAGIIGSYRLRIAGVTRDYTKEDRAQAPQDSRSRHG
jgi:heme-degrading monooxygenase HmoA